MTTYVAITTTNPRFGWYEVGRGNDKAAVRREAERELTGPFWDVQKPLVTQTELVNLRVVSKTKAERKFKVRTRYLW